MLDTNMIEIKTSIGVSYTQEFDTSGEVLYDEKDIKIIAKGIEQDSIWGPELVLFIENNSSDIITIQTRNTSINGFMVDPTFSPEIVPGKKEISSMTFMSSDLETNNITNINEIETSFHIFRSSDWASITDTEPIIITF